MFFTSNASGQWYINTSTNLETDIAGTFGTYVNVAVDNHLSVNTNTTTCPLATSASATFDYPFVVNDINSGTTNIGTAIVLWDNGGDHIRKIIGLSPAGGVAIYSGNDDQTGSGIRLNSPGSSTAGLVQTISQVPGTNKAFEHLNYAGGTLNSIYSINGNGDVLVTGKQTSQKYLSVNLNSTPACPSVTGGSTLVDYPLVVNDISGSGTAIVLWDNTADPIRNIIGLSPAGGVAMYSGNDDHTGSGIRLNAPGSTTYPAGSVQTISTATATGPGIPAFEHYSYAPLPLASGATMNRVFSVADNGDIKVAGKLSFPFLGGDNGFRLIEGLSPCWGIKMYTGDPITPGTQIVMTSPIPPIVCSTPTGYTQGLMQFRADALGATGIGLSYDFTALNPTAAAALHCMRINNNSNASIGPFTAPTPTDRLAVDGNLYLNSFDNNDPTYRNIFAKSALSGLNVSSGAFTDGSDGASFNAFSWNTTPYGAYPAGPYQGAFVVHSSAWGSCKDCPLGFGYMSYIGAPTGGANHHVFSISKLGFAITGMDATLLNINMAAGPLGPDVFTVKNYLGFYDPTDGDYERTIHGNSVTGGLQMYSNTSNQNGSGIELWASGHPAWPGQIHLISDGTTGVSTYISNWDGTTWHSNVVVSNLGETVIGHDGQLSNITPGDILTVKNRIGMYAPTAGVGVSIAGNSHVHDEWLSIYANSGSTNGGTIELFGPNATMSSGPTGWDADRRGEVRITAYADGLPADHYGQMFYSYYSSAWHPHMAITNGGKVIIGENLINLQNFMSTNTYDLYVENGILTEQVRVALRTTSDWTDYVFAKDYKLMPLKKVEAYVNANKHLPGVPGAEQVKEEGIDIAKMDAKLLQKIEELTLYMIEQEKRIDELQKKLEEKRK